MSLQLEADDYEVPTDFVGQELVSPPQPQPPSVMTGDVKKQTTQPTTVLPGRPELFQTRGEQSLVRTTIARQSMVSLILKWHDKSNVILIDDRTAPDYVVHQIVLSLSKSLTGNQRVFSSGKITQKWKPNGDIERDVLHDFGMNEGHMRHLLLEDDDEHPLSPTCEDLKLPVVACGWVAPLSLSETVRARIEALQSHPDPRHAFNELIVLTFPYLG